MSKLKYATASVILAALALAGCTAEAPLAGPPQTPPTTRDRATVTGHVLDAAGVPLSAAVVSVRATGELASTDSEGAFVLDVPADTTLTLAATALGMAPTLLQQLLLAPGGQASLLVWMLPAARVAALAALGTDTSGGVVAITVRSAASSAPAATGVDGATIEIFPSSLGRVLYAAAAGDLPDPDPSLTALPRGSSAAWALGVRPHVSITGLELRGATQLEFPYIGDDVTWPGTFTVEAGTLTLVTLLIP